MDTLVLPLDNEIELGGGSRLVGLFQSRYSMASALQFPYLITSNCGFPEKKDRNEMWILDEETFSVRNK